MKHRNSHFAVGYWSRIRKDRLIPDQADIDPRALKRLLPNVFLLESRTDGSFVYRLAGTAICERYGVELRGMSFLSRWHGESRAALPAILRQALRLRTPLCLNSVAATEDCRMIEIETVLMPLTHGSEEPKRFLGVAQILTDVIPIAGQTLTLQRLTSSALIHEGEAKTSSEAPPPSLPPSTLPPPSINHHPRAPHLRLVVSRERPAAPRQLRNDSTPPQLQNDASDTLRRLLDLCSFDRGLGQA